MHTFSEYTRRILCEAGWHEGRVFDTTAYEATLHSKEITPSPAVLNFLREFGGLYLRFPHPRAPDSADDAHFDVIEATEGYEAEEHRDIVEIMEVEVCPIGQASRGYILLFMDTEGRVFGTYVDAYFYGSSPDEALDTICQGGIQGWPLRNLE